MLSTIREKTQGWIAAVILGLIAIPFALWGVNYYFEGGNRLSVAQVNGQDISVDSYRRILEEQRRMMQQSMRRGSDTRFLDSPEFRQGILDAMIDDLLAGADVEDQGYRIGNADLAQVIREAPQFQREGKFDPALYNLMLRSSGLDPRSFESQLRRERTRRQMESAYAQSAILTPSDISALLKLSAQEREAALAVLGSSRLRERIRIGTEAVEQEYQTHPERYKTVERVRIEYVRLAAEDFSKTVRVGDEELRLALAEAQQGAAGKEGRRASHILVKLAENADAVAEKAAKSKIDGLRDKLQSGADFASLAKQNSDDPGSAAQGGDLGQVTRGMMVKEFEAALYALKKAGDFSAPVRTKFGYHLIKLTGVESAAALTAAQRARIEEDLRKRKAEERYYEISERFQNLVYEQSDSLKPAATALGLRIETSPWFARGEAGTGPLANPKVQEAAFDPEVLTQGRNSAAIETAPNTLISLRVVSHEPSRQRPLADVRGEIEKTLIEAQRQEEAGRLAQEILKRLEQGESLESVARQYGMNHNPARVYGRRAAGVDASMLDALFRTARPENGKPAYGSAVLADGSLAVFALKRVIEPEKVKLDGPEADSVRRLLEARRGRELLESYRADLRARAKIKIYKDQL